MIWPHSYIITLLNTLSFILAYSETLDSKSLTNELMLLIIMIIYLGGLNLQSFIHRFKRQVCYLLLRLVPVQTQKETFCLQTGSCILTRLSSDS